MREHAFVVVEEVDPEPGVWYVAPIEEAKELATRMGGTLSGYVETERGDGVTIYKYWMWREVPES